MARASAAAENAAVSGVTAIAVYLSLHTADPGTTGASEHGATGGYARQSITWGSPSGGSAANTNAISVPIAASTTVSYFGTWSASSGGTYEIGGALSSSVTTGSTAGTVTFAAGAVTLAAA